MVKQLRITLVISLFFCFNNPLVFAQATRLLATADSLAQAEQYEEAVQFLESFIQKYPNRKMDQANAYFQISYNQMQLGNYTEAERNNNRSLKIRNKLGSDAVAENYMRKGSLLLLKGDFESAFDNLFKARELPTEDPHIYALINGYIASGFSELGNWEKALHYYDESLAILEIELGEEHPDVATTYYNIGKLYTTQSIRDKAEENLNKALQIELANNARQSQLGNIYNAQAVLAYEYGEEEKAQSLHQKALEAFQKTFGEKHRETGRTHLNLARIALAKSELKTAKKETQAALISLCIDFNDPNFDKNPNRTTITLNRSLLLNALKLKSAIQVLDFEEYLNNDYLKSAIATSSLGVHILEDLLNILTEEASKLRLLKEELDIFESGIIAATKLYDRTGDITYAEKAFEFGEKGKATILRSNTIPMIENNRGFAIARRLENRTRRFIREAEIALDLDPENQNLWQRLREKRAAYRDFLVQLKDKQTEYFNLRYNYNVVHPTQIQTSLEEDELFVSYFMGQTQYYIFAISKDNFQIHSLDNNYGSPGEKMKTSLKDIQKQSKDLGTGVGVYTKLDIRDLPVPALDQAIDAYLTSIKKMNGKNFLVYSNSLYGKLIYPIRSMLKGKEKLIFVPHSKLNLIPFEALVSKIDKPDKVKYHKLDYLIKDYSIQYQYSATLFHKIKSSNAYANPANATFLGLAPVFNPGEGTGYIWNSHDYVFDTTYQNATTLREISPDGKSFSQLQYSENEVVSIAALFAKEKQSSKAYLHKEASEDQFKALADDYQILHIASHSFVNEANPRLSGIAFAQPDSDKNKEDGILYAPEIYNLTTNADLVVLSSCESGTGQIIRGEGVLSLSRAFQNAGVENIVSSLWKVYDRYTSQLMLPFYENILEGKNYSAALRKAKLKMIKDKKAAAPRKWAGFILIGNE